MGYLKKRVLALVLAGGKGERLYPLTLERTKPSVPFGGKYRIIDFALSNFINSGVYSIYVLVQYKSQSLIEHIRKTWRKVGVLSQHFITVVPPQMRREEVKDWYRGTADSVYHNINLIYDFKPEIVAVFSGDHIYRMDISKMIDYHFRKKAELTLSTVSVSKEEACHFGIVDINKEKRIIGFKEKPSNFKENSCFASMGNYIFNPDLLIKALEEDVKRNTSHDFGRDIIPFLIKSKIKTYAYDFSQNRVSSLKNYEAKFYWKDVGTIKSYWQANMDLLGEKPLLDLDNQYWPIYSSSLNCPSAYIKESQISNSFIGEGSKVIKVKMNNSILGRGVKIEKGVTIDDSIIMDFTHVKSGCKIKKTIIDRFNVIERNQVIGYDKDRDKKNYYLDPSGIVVLKRGLRKISWW